MIAQTHPPVRPIIKWAGGKSKLLATLLARRPHQLRRYFEPFLGGGALFFALGAPHAILGDKNSALIDMYRWVARDVEGVIRRLAIHRRRHDESYYYQVRTRLNAGGYSPIQRAAAFIYLNKTCYNGLYRVNRKGGFNVPVGRYVNPAIVDPPSLRAAALVLARAELLSSDYSWVGDRAEAGDLVYFDPPYWPRTATANFTSYTAAGFAREDQIALAELARKLGERGCAVMVSNSDTELVRDIYRDFAITQVSVARAINSKASSRQPVSELVITANLPEPDHS